MDLDAVGAVLELVVVADGLGRQLALLADRHEAHAKLVGDRGADDEAARLDARDLADRLALVAFDDLVDRAAQSHRVLEQRGDVAEHDPLVGIVRDGANEGLDGHFFLLVFSTRPATAESRLAMRASRACGAVMSACSSALRQEQPAALRSPWMRGAAL